MIGLVFAGGPAPSSDLAPSLPDDALVIAADSGVDHALALGFSPTVVVGDMDSISEEARRWAATSGATVLEHPVAKDATDLDLALELAAERCAEIVVVEGGGGRLDQALGNIMLIAGEKLAAVTLSAHVGDALVTVVRDHREIVGAPGSTLSLLAVAGPAEGITTTGLRWELSEATLRPGDSLGVSNELVTSPARVSLRAGVLLAVQPRRPDPPLA